MPDFSAKMHQIQFRLGLRPIDPTGESCSWFGEGWLPPLSKNTYPLSALQASIQLFSETSPSQPLNQKVKLPICAQGRHVILSSIGTPHLLNQRYVPVQSRQVTWFKSLFGTNRYTDYSHTDASSNLFKIIDYLFQSFLLYVFLYLFRNVLHVATSRSVTSWCLQTRPRPFYCLPLLPTPPAELLRHYCVTSSLSAMLSQQPSPDR